MTTEPTDSRLWDLSEAYYPRDGRIELSLLPDLEQRWILRRLRAIWDAARAADAEEIARLRDEAASDANIIIGFADTVRRLESAGAGDAAEIASWQRLFKRHDVSNLKHYEEAVEERIAAEAKCDALAQQIAAVRALVQPWREDGSLSGMSYEDVAAQDVKDAVRAILDPSPTAPEHEDETNPDECPACDTPLDKCSADDACCEDCNHAACWPPPVTPESTAEVSTRRLAVMFLNLPMTNRIDIAKRFGVWDEGDVTVPRDELSPLILGRIRVAGLINRLATELGVTPESETN